ncbi:MAG: molybdenum cofactor guanylyltransferase [Sporomusa sp.]|nr:molybdenum cofactor guanylyltransferase [Sporomusa sp.]
MSTDQFLNIEMAGIVLAGGLSTRMGKDKAALTWNGSDFLNTVLSRLEPVCSELIVVSNVPRSLYLPNVRIVSDNYNFCGPLAGMQAGISASNYSYNFITACDMPYINTQAVAYTGLVAIGYDAAVPFIDGFFNPLHGVYHRNCLTHIERMLKQGQYRISDFYDKVNLRKISRGELVQFDQELKTLTNINTPGDLLC